MRLVLIDGHAILHRAYHAYPPLTTSKGEMVGAVYGFTSILLTVLKKLQPEFVAVAFDRKEPTFRHKKFKKYKAHRKPVDRELLAQIPRVKQVVKTLNIPVFEVAGYEADDVIGTLVRQGKHLQKSLLCRDKGDSFVEILIVTGDQDALQLVDDKVKVYMPARGKKPERIFDKEKIVKKYGLKPEQIVDLKALAGDPSDGIPGVAGIGPKTAVRLLQKFGTVEAVYQALDSVALVVTKSIRSKLLAGRQSAKLSKKLAQIITDVPIELDLKSCQIHDYDKNKILQLFEKLEFRSLIKRLPDDDYEKMVRETMDGKKARLKTEKSTKKTENGEQMGLF